MKNDAEKLKALFNERKIAFIENRNNGWTLAVGPNDKYLEDTRNASASFMFAPDGTLIDVRGMSI